MAHFYGDIDGKAKTHASRTGSKLSGMEAHIRGWNTGVRVICEYDDNIGEDVIKIFVTGGSNKPSGELLATLEGNSLKFANPKLNLIKRTED